MFGFAGQGKTGCGSKAQLATNAHMGWMRPRPLLHAVACTDELRRMSVAACTQDLTALRAFLPYVEVVEFRDDAATHYAQIRADVKKRGQMIGANDLLIAAHTRSLGLALVTNNTAEFGRVRGLTIDNWALPVRGSRSREE